MIRSKCFVNILMREQIQIYVVSCRFIEIFGFQLKYRRILSLYYIKVKKMLGNFDKQILHQNTKHHISNLYKQLQQKNLKNQIESSEQPIKNYRSAIKTLYHDQLESSINDFNNKKIMQKQNRRIFNEEYQKDCQYQRQILQRSRFARKKYYDCFNEDLDSRQKLFVDANQMHNKKIQNHINNNIDPARFYHIQEEYEHKKSIEKEKLKQVLNTQVKEKQMKSFHEKQQKQQAVNKRLQILKYFKDLDNVDKIKKMEIQKLYTQELNQSRNRGLMRNNSLSNMNQKSSKCYIYHNPITNPLEFHIQNPYILKKISENPRIL